MSRFLPKTFFLMTILVGAVTSSSIAFATPLKNNEAGTVNTISAHNILRTSDKLQAQLPSPPIPRDRDDWDDDWPSRPPIFSDHDDWDDDRPLPPARRNWSRRNRDAVQDCLREDDRDDRLDCLEDTRDRIERHRSRSWRDDDDFPTFKNSKFPPFRD